MAKLNGQDGQGSASQEAFRARMEAQCHKIEQYRRALIKKGGETLTDDEAAREWIEHYADAFDGDEHTTEE